MDSNVTHIGNIVRQGGTVYSFVIGLNYLYLRCIWIPLFVAITSNIALITYLNIQCDNACIPDFRNLCNIVNVGWKRKYIDTQTKCFSICTKPTLFSAQMNG